jgi:sterol desaturase/sphingolipid hydroxylase (fatty acid hydroxylase superfamily)
MLVSLPLFAVAGIVFVGVLARYALLAGAAFGVFHRLPFFATSRRRLGPVANTEQVRRELRLALSSAVVFALVGVCTTALRRAGMEVKAPGWLAEHPVLWSLGSLVVMVVIHDAYFYAAHRLMHTRWLFKHVHRAHHLSHDPSPLTANAFHPVEALLEAAIAPMILLVLPVPPVTLFVFQMWAMLFNIYGHLGVELWPAWLARSPFGRLVITTTHHHQHHRLTKWNFGLYFNVWDRVFGTNHPEYQARLLAVTAEPHHLAGSTGTLALEKGRS